MTSAADLEPEVGYRSQDSDGLHDCGSADPIEEVGLQGGEGAATDIPASLSMGAPSLS